MAESFVVRTPEGAAAGTLTVTVNGPRTTFSYESREITPPSRLVLVGAEGYVSLGVPVPEGEGMRLHRTVTRMALGGLDPTGDVSPILAELDRDPAGLIPAPPPPVPEKAPEPEDSAPDETPPPGSEGEPEPEPELPESPQDAPEPEGQIRWIPEPEPEGYFTDPLLRDACRDILGVLAGRDGADVRLAFPYDPARPFPMMPIFRRGALTEIGGRQYIVFPTQTEGEKV